MANIDQKYEEIAGMLSNPKHNYQKTQQNCRFRLEFWLQIFSQPHLCRLTCEDVLFRIELCNPLICLTNPETAPKLEVVSGTNWTWFSWKLLPTFDKKYVKSGDTWAEFHPNLQTLPETNSKSHLKMDA